jgi:hypothetical protein
MHFTVCRYFITSCRCTCLPSPYTQAPQPPIHDFLLRLDFPSLSSFLTSHFSSSRLLLLIMMAATEGLFSASLISPEVVASLPPGYTVRSLQKDDFARGYLDCLRVLTHVGDLTVEDFNERYEEMAQLKGTYCLLVMVYENRIVGTGSLIIEKKL